MSVHDTSAIRRADPGASELEMIRGTRAVLDLLAGQWSIDVLYLLASGTRRYSAIFYEVGEISKKTLTQTLRTLEANGLVTRRAYAEVPVRVEYSLAPLGWSITRLASRNSARERSALSPMTPKASGARSSEGPTRGSMSSSRWGGSA